MKALTRLKYFVILVTLILIVISAVYYTETKELIDSSAKTTGTVVMITPKKSQNNLGRAEILFYPTVRFKTEKNQIVTFESTFGTNIVHTNVGEQIPVIYDPETPKNAKINLFVEIWYKSIISGAASLLFIIFSLILIVIVPRPKAKP